MGQEAKKTSQKAGRGARRAASDVAESRQWERGATGHRTPELSAAATGDHNEEEEEKQPQ